MRSPPGANTRGVIVNVAPAVCLVAVIVPTLNEAANVPRLVAALDRALGTYAYEILFVDDWSTDGTPDAVAALADIRTNIRLIRRFGRRGLSSAVVEGVLATLAPIVAVIDADMQHDEAILPRLIDAVADGTADIAIGSRYAPGGSTGTWDAARARGSRLATLLARRLLPVPVADPMSGFFVTRQATLIAALPRLSNLGFKILLDLIVSSPTPPRIAEIPFTFRERTAGTSKLDSSVAIDFLLLLLDKSVGRYVPPRLVLFGAVGLLGLGVDLGLLRAGLALGATFKLAKSVGVAGAIAFNFTLNNNLTYRDQRLTGSRLLTGLLSFYAVCGLGAVANVGVGNAVFEREHRWWLAGIAGAVVGSMWNYAASRAVTWRKRAG